MLKPAVGSWECKDCYTRNSAGGTACVGCQAPAAQPAEIFKPAPTSWSCKGCKITNNQSSQHCVACDMPQDPSMPPKHKATGGFLIRTGATDVTPNKVISVKEGTVDSKPSDKAVSSLTFSSCSKKTTMPNPSGLTFGTEQPTSSQSSDKGEVTFGSPGKPFNFQFQAKSPKSSEKGDDDDEQVEESDDLNFTPIFPLPDKVNLKTGEEDEEVVFSHRETLFKFDRATKECKMGPGDIKLLRHSDTKKLRLVMRRKQITAKDDKIWMWIAGDYSEGEIEYVQIGCRSNTSKIAEEVKTAIDKVCKGGDCFPSVDNPKVNSESLPEIVVVYESKVTPEEKAAALKLQLPENFYAYKYKADCPGCRGCRESNDSPFDIANKLTTTTASAATTLDVNADVEGVVNKKLTIGELFAKLMDKMDAISREIADLKRESVDLKSVILQTKSSCESKSDDGSTKSLKDLNERLEKLELNLEKQREGCTQEKLTTAHAQSTELACGQEAKKTTETGIENLKISDPSVPVTTATSLPATNNFSQFGASQKFTLSYPIFPQFSSITTASNFSTQPVVTTTSSIFGSQPLTTTFSHSKPVFDSGSKSLFSLNNKPTFGSDDRSIFGEENEEVVYSHRAKLFNYDTATKEWKERGLGDIKLLRHSDTKKLRLVMRREQILTICLNHAVTASLILLPRDDKTWTWVAIDYSEDETGAVLQLSCSFKTPKIAKEFKEVIDKACKDGHCVPSVDKPKADSKPPSTDIFGVGATASTVTNSTFNGFAGTLKPISGASPKVSQSATKTTPNSCVFGSSFSTAALTFGMIPAQGNAPKSTVETSPNKVSCENDDKGGETNLENQVNVIFRQPAKLLKNDGGWNDKGWEELGIGEMKIVYCPELDTYQLVFYSETAHKVVYFMNLTEKLHLLEFPQSSPAPNKAWRWSGINYLRPKDFKISREFVVGFKSAELASNFKKAVDDTITGMLVKKISF